MYMRNHGRKDSYCQTLNKSKIDLKVGGNNGF